mmetsp:Transcript_27278/g.40304  ORF Transcript_27278/g.40304 Transcript_27278/m.40304 type:complete len:490 (+) Transcript_27278:49-1518(+)
MNSFKTQEYGEIHERNDMAGQLTRPNLQYQEQSPLRQSPSSSLFGPTHGTCLLGTPKSNAHQLNYSSQIIRPRVEQSITNSHSNSNSISAHNSFAMSTPLSMSISTAPKQQWHEVSVSHPSHYPGAGYSLHPQPQCRPYAVHHDRHLSQRRRIAGYRQGPFPSPQPLYAANIHDEHKGAFASRGCTTNDPDQEVEQIMSNETPWNRSPHEYEPAQLPAPCHLPQPQPQPHHPYHYDQHQHHYPIHHSNFYASHPYSSYYHPNAQQQQQPRYHPSPSPHPYSHPHPHPHSHLRERKRKYRRSRKEFIINVDRSLSPALSDITASPTPSMDEFDDDNYEDNNNNDAAEKEKYNKSFKAMLQPLLECHKTTDVTVTQLRIDTSSPSDNLNVNMDPPRIERKSSLPSKKQTTFDWNIDVDSDNVVRTVSPMKSSPRKEDITPISRCDHSNSNSNHLSKKKKVWRQKKSQDDVSQRFLIANNISQSSSSQWDGA